MKNKNTTFYLVRHGETDWNSAGMLQGQTDIPLNAAGEKQALELAGKLRNVQFDHVFSSDLLRAKKTAEIVATERRMITKTTQLLRERSFGKFEGMHFKEFQALFTNWEELSEEQRWNHVVGNEESHEKFTERVTLFLRETALAFPGKTILVICHGGLMGSLLIKLGYFTFATRKYFNNCGYIILDSDGVEFEIKDVKGLK